MMKPILFGFIIGRATDHYPMLKNSKIGLTKKLAKLKSNGTSPLDTILVPLRTSHAA